MVVIIGHESRELIVEFDIKDVRETAAFTSEEPKEMYNNIVIFKASKQPEETGNNSDNMHIFQCLNVNARDMVSDLKQLQKSHVRTSAAKSPGVVQLETGNKDETSSTFSDVDHKDVDNLNSCFADIEIFIQRLQRIAQAFR